MFSCQTDELMPVRFDEEFHIWIAAKQPLKNTTFLSKSILDFCGELPIFWLHTMYPKGSLYFFQSTIKVIGGHNQHLIYGNNFNQTHIMI